LLTLAVYTV